MKTLRDLRNDRAMTQEGVAEIIDSSKVNVSRIENGHNYPNTQTMHRLAEAYNMPVGEIVLAARATADEKKKLESQIKSGDSDDSDDSSAVKSHGQDTA